MAGCAQTQQRKVFFMKQQTAAHQEPRYLVTAAVSSQVRQMCEPIQARLLEAGIRPNNLGPHITLKTPFTTEHLSPERRQIPVHSVFDQMHTEQALSRTTIVFGSLKHFDNGSEKILYLPVESEKAHDMARQAVRAFEIFGIPPARYDAKILHLTLASHLTRKTFPIARNILMQSTLPVGTMRIDTIVLHLRDNGHWDEVAEYPLH